jgi:alpha-ketoglutarate-dependent taurine dioxygenase
VLERQLSYWKEQLQGAAPVLELPTDKPRPPVQTFNGFTSFLNINKSLSESLEGLGRNNEVTMFMLFLTVFQVLLHYNTKQDDIVIGTDATNRSQIDTEGLIGFFINQLVLRGRLSSGATFTELLAQAREISLSAYTHQDFPFDKLVEALKPKRDLRYPPLFQVKFFYQNAPATVPTFTDLIIENLDFNRGISRLDLTLALWPTPYGFRGWFNYNKDLFTEGTITQMSEQFKSILARVVEQPDVTLDELEAGLAASQQAQQSMEKQKLIESKFSKFQKIKPKPVNVPPETLVKTSLMQLGGMLPLVIQPLLDHVDLVSWTKNSGAFIEEKLLHHGAILFRGFGIKTPQEFEQCAMGICPKLFNESGEHPRQAISSNVYTPVFYPPDKQLLWHNENSFNYQWPGKIWFGCVKPADRGGETPIVDSRKVFQAIAPEIRERFIERKIMYSRNYGEETGLSWQMVFQTSEKAEVESYCRRWKMEFEWKANDRLRTRCVRPAVINHPKTKDPVWFNQAQHWHLSCLDEMTRASLLSVFPEDDLPRNCYYGDGSIIEDAVMADICRVYQELEVCYPWQTGDVLLLDNMLTAHGRNAFVGERKLLVAMGEMICEADI